MGIDLQAIATKATDIAFGITETIQTTATLHLGKTETQSLENDTASSSGGQDPTVDGIFGRRKQVQGVEATTMSARFIIKESDVPAGLELDEADTATIEGDVWQVVDVSRPIKKTVFILELRK